MSAQPRSSDKGWVVGQCFLPSFQGGCPTGQGQDIQQLHICSLLCPCLSPAWLRINPELHSMELSLHQDRSCLMYSSRTSGRDLGPCMCQKHTKPLKPSFYSPHFQPSNEVCLQSGLPVATGMEGCCQV